ncbi:hypothetical protein EIN_371650 [Entamoeba invadens IP1]|uniref:Tc3 transposase DNA binding domain-containing protein n=1 Tax=Entamoeba invadens IP1 TaxID=370355 RepID=A0A0A1UC87_ENTIV|nr:hypothetical protein EIN_371650 [Entamoeba invadens IP1]ELP92753.1 hypothetical protein EIN_371650 [Entamoeba invadens IP1]|eukprot:XP_004259524.1 hypothetical protein EIN_371650 [Entamoeba invadens IP1]
MISPRRPLTDDIKLQILTEKEQNGSSVYAIAKKIGRSPSTVRCFLKCYGNDHQLSRKRGRKPKLTEEIEDFIAQFADNKDVSCSRIATEIKKKFPDVSLSKETVRVIRQKLGKNPDETPLSSSRINYFENGVYIEDERKEFADKILALNRPVILSNTSVFCVKGNGTLTRCSNGGFPVITAFTATGKALEVTVWGAIGSGWKSPMVRIVNDISLGEVLKKGMISEQLVEKYGPHVLLDEQVLKGEDFPFLENFPIDSSDLNPINDLFLKMQGEVNKMQFRNEEELFAYVQFLWGVVNEAETTMVVAEFFERINRYINSPRQSKSMPLSF